MTGTPGFLEFFILEASDYVEQLDGLLLGGGSGAPDADALQRIARALRGTATMAKITPFADVAAAVERVGRALHDGAVQWNPSLGSALVAAVDDLKALLHSARAWSPADDQRARARAAELSSFAPTPSAPAAAPASTAATGAPPFLATEAANIAAGLELLATRPGDADTAGNVLRRVRALRGVAGVKEVAPLAEVLEATEDAARSLEIGGQTLGPEARGVLDAAAAQLRELSTILREGGDVAASKQRDAFVAALQRWHARERESERIVPIAELFYADGGGIVEAAPNPPTSLADRFRLELVSQGEHLRAVLAAARAAAADPDARARTQRELRRSLEGLQSAAQSFGETEVAAFIGEHASAADHIDFLGLSALDDLAAIIAQPGEHTERLAARLSELRPGRDLAAAIGSGLGPGASDTGPGALGLGPGASGLGPGVRPTAPSALDAMFAAPEPQKQLPVPASLPTPSSPGPRPQAPSPRSSTLADLESSIAALEKLTSQPLAEPIPLPEDDVVPIENLLYRGRAALDRAVEIRDELRRAGSTDQIALDELFDLLELARAE